MVDERGESIGPHRLVDKPVAEARSVVAPPAKPAVVEHVTLGTHSGSRVGQRLQAVEVEVEVDRFPGIEGDGARAGRMIRAASQHLVDASGELGEPVAPGRDGHRGRVALTRRKAHLAGQKQFTGLQHGVPGDDSFRAETVVAAPSEVHGVDEPAGETEPGCSGGQQQGSIGAGTPGAALPLVATDGEGMALRGAFTQVPPGRVENLGGSRRQRECGGEAGEVVVRGVHVGERQRLGQQAGVGEDEGDDQLEPGVGIDRRDGGRRGIHPTVRPGCHLGRRQCGRKREATTTAAEARGALPAEGVLRQKGEACGDVETARNPLRE